MSDHLKVSKWLVGICVTILICIGGFTVKALTWGSALTTRVDYIASTLDKIENRMDKVQGTLESRIFELEKKSHDKP